jgi:hypothetical protein
VDPFLVIATAWASAATLVAVALAARRDRSSTPLPLPSPVLPAALLAAARAAGRRYEIRLLDLGEYHQPVSMRWQATVYDAERTLRTEVYVDPADDPEGSLGVEAPYWLANARDAAAALDAAAGWVLGEGGVLVVSGRAGGSR